MLAGIDVGDIGRHWIRQIGAQLIGQALEDLDAARGQDDPRSLGNELSGAALADARACPGNDYDLSFESSHADFFLASSILWPSFMNASSTLSPDLALA